MLVTLVPYDNLQKKCGLKKSDNEFFIAIENS